MTGPFEGTRVHRLSLPTPFEVGDVNVYLVKGDALTLVDTGPRTEAACTALESGLKALGVTIPDLDLILLTHGHLDHIGLLGRLMEESGAESWAHPHAAARTASYEEDAAESREFFRSIMRDFGVPADEIEVATSDQASYRPYGAPAAVTHILEDGARVADYIAYHAPGHSSSDTLLVDVSLRDAFVGDHLLTTTNPNPLIRRPAPGQPRPKSLLEFMESLRRTRDLDLRWSFPGHGDPFLNHREAVDRLLTKLDERSARVLSCMGANAFTPYQLSRCLYPRLETKYLYLGLSVAIGHLEALEACGQTQSEWRDGILYFRAT